MDALNPYGAGIIFNDFYMNYQVGFATFLLVFMWITHGFGII